MKINLDFQPVLFNDPILRDTVRKIKDNFYELQAALAGIVPAVNEPTTADMEFTSDHGELEGLADDDHLQYLLLAGRSSDQIVLALGTANVALTLRAALGSTSSRRILDVQANPGSPTSRFYVEVTGNTQWSFNSTGAKLNIPWNIGGQNTTWGTSGSSVLLSVRPTASDLQIEASGGPVVFEMTTASQWHFDGPLNIHNRAVDSASTVTFQIGKRTGQTGNLTEWRDSTSYGGGSLLAYVDVAGNASFASISAISSAEFADDIFRIVGSVTDTKKLAFEVDGLSVGTRTLTPQDANYTIAGLETAQTFVANQVVDGTFEVLDTTTLQNTDVQGNFTADLMIDDDCIFVNVFDASKRLHFVLDGQTAGTLAAIITSNTDDRNYTLPDASGTLALLSKPQTWTGLQSYPDDKFEILGNVDDTKKIVFDADGSNTGVTGTIRMAAEATKYIEFALQGSAGADLQLVWLGTADRQLTLPSDISTDLAGLDVADQEWTGNNVFLGEVEFTDSSTYDTPVPIFHGTYDSTAFLSRWATFADDDSIQGSGYNIYLIPPSGSLTSDINISLPTSSGTLVGTGEATTLFQKTIAAGAAGAGIRCSTTTTVGVKFINGTNPVNFMMLDLSNLTTQNNYKGQNYNGTLPLVGNGASASGKTMNKVDLTGQTANITSTNLVQAGSAGVYQVDVYALCTTVSGSGSPTLDVNISWTDTVGATSSTVVSGLALHTSTGRAQGTVLCQLAASNNIAFTATINSPSGSPQFALYIRVTAKG